jgi:hypothetical protein
MAAVNTTASTLLSCSGDSISSLLTSQHHSLAGTLCSLASFGTNGTNLLGQQLLQTELSTDDSLLLLQSLGLLLLQTEGSFLGFKSSTAIFIIGTSLLVGFTELLQQSGLVLQGQGGELCKHCVSFVALFTME